MFAEDEYVTLSSLQHYTFCPRRCALIYTEQLWEENALTIFGKLEHKRVDTAPDSNRDGIRTARSVRLVCHRLGIQGVADVVEYHAAHHGENPVPVEYKHGRPASHKADDVQLCAQALCLEEMHRCQIGIGYLYYHSIRSRVRVELDEELRERTCQAIKETRHLLMSRALPPGYRHKSCGACSLVDICLPLPGAMSAMQYNEQNLVVANSAFLIDETAS